MARRPPISMKLEVDDLMKKIAEFDKKLRRKVMRQVGAAVTKVMKPVMKSLVPVRSGWLRKVISNKAKFYETKMRLWVGVGPKSRFRVALQKKNKKKFQTLGTVRKIKGVKVGGKNDAILEVNIGKNQAGFGGFGPGKTKGLGSKLKPGFQKGQSFHEPSRIAHLAGPGRKARFVRATLSQTRAGVRAAMVRVLSSAIKSA